MECNEIKIKTTSKNIIPIPTFARDCNRKQRNFLRPITAIFFGKNEMVIAVVALELQWSCELPFWLTSSPCREQSGTQTRRDLSSSVAASPAAAAAVRRRSVSVDRQLLVPLNC